jgi:serine/threonine-protein kinase HipA
MLDYDLAKSVGVFFRLGEQEMDKIIEEVRVAVGKWRQVAAEIGISRPEQELMAGAFTLSTK